ncbi:4'-phosphopantetheine phosphatase isoform X2 [Malaya genurostris]|uniref:4'-phosphopantetheine phosphatase isoform X2 n=1 Tax=Malaya genurostris TaxID=325434 RepID=UPI0026F3B38F|nr:4'-phosphopantetheine phosphatase isoform X2 [Malaya genurostris]
MSVHKRFYLLKDIDGYSPDTLDLHQDKEAKEYWFNCFYKLVLKFEQQAAKSQNFDPTAVERAAKFREHYLAKLEQLKQDDCSFRPLSIRNLLELNESTLRMFGFDDPWKEQKLIENSGSIKKLNARLHHLDQLENSTVKWIEIVKGVLAGNMFDWGAQAVSQILESDANFGLKEAIDRIQKRPWLIDCLDQWLERMQGTAHRCATIFTDNSGIDIVLGILPLVRELLLRQTKVLLCANNNPALNDITYEELREVIKQCCTECDVIKYAFHIGMLKILGNDQNGPCLDFRLITPDLCNEIVKSDLVIIVGMARALHTNLNTKFTCETLKLAVIKNEWLAKRLGGETFSVICKYENI